MTKKSDRRNLTEGPILKKLFLFALPLLGSNLIQQLYNTVDVFFAGNFIAGNAMAAVGATSMIVSLLVCFFNGMSVGCSVVISQAFGEGSKEKLSHSVHSAVGIALIGGILISIIGFFLSPHILMWMQTPADILEMASTYIQIYFLSVLSLVVYNICTGILRAAGDSRNPLIYQCIGGVCNVIGDYLLIAVFDMGIMGIAIATLFSQTIPAVIVFVHLLITKKPYRIVIRKIRIHKETFLKIIRIGIPAGVQSMVITLSNIFVQAQINSLGTDTIGAFTAYFRIELIMYLPIVAFGQAISTFVGQNVGSGQLHRVSKGVRVTLLMGIACTILTSAFVLIFNRYCFAFFGATQAEIEIGMRILYMNASLYFLYNFLEVFSEALRGSGDSVVPMLIVVGNMCGVRLAALFILVNLFHTVESVAICYPITWLTASLSLGIYYYCSKLHKDIKAHKATHRMGHPEDLVTAPDAAPGMHKESTTAPQKTI